MRKREENPMGDQIFVPFCSGAYLQTKLSSHSMAMGNLTHIIYIFILSSFFFFL
jgi:hypothetical protein